MTKTELKRARAKLGMTQEELAREVGTNLTTYVRWEMGLHRVPKMLPKLLTLLKPKK